MLDLINTYSVSYTGTTLQGDTIPNGILYGGYVYIVAGSPASGSVWNTIQKFNIATNTMSTVSYSGTLKERYAQASVLYGSFIYTIGGQTGPTLGYEVLSDVVVFDILASSISTVTTSGTTFTSRLLHTATLTSASIYVIGGFSGAGTYLNDVWVFNIATSTWSQLTTTGTTFTSRRQHTATLYANLIYVIGGFNGGYLNEVWTFNIVTNAWSLVSYSGIFTARNSHSATLYNGVIYVIGGTSTINNIQSFSIATNTWTTISSAAPTFSAHTAVLYNNFIYTLGGYLNGRFIYMYPLVAGNHITTLSYYCISFLLRHVYDNKDTFVKTLVLVNALFIIEAVINENDVSLTRLVSIRLLSVYCLTRTIAL